MELHVKLTSQIDEIQRRLRQCNFECNRLKEEIAESLPALIRAKDVAEKRAHELSLQAKSRDLPTAEPETIELTTETVLPESEKPVEAPATVPVEAVDPPVVEEQPVLQHAITVPETPAPVAESRPKARPKEKKQTNLNASKSTRSLEEFIGGNLLNKVGIGILIIGIGIFVKYAIDQDWIGSVGRVLIGLLSGGILLGIAHRLRKKYKAFSSVLLGGGIAVLYFSVAIAFHQYHLLSQGLAFGMMCVITAGAVVFSLAYNRQEIAILALLGGFATPFMASTGEGNYIALFTYLLVLNVGMMILSWFRDWDVVRILSYAVTLLLFGGWLAMNLFWTDVPVLGGALAFATVYFLVFFAMNLAFTVRKQQTIGAKTYIMLLTNTMFYYAASMLILNQIEGGQYMGLFTALMGVFHFAFIFPLRKLIKVDNKLQLLLVGIVLTFLTLAIPIQLEGSFITLFWAGEAVVLLLLAQRTNIKLLRIGSQVVSALAVIGLAWDWAVLYFQAWPTGRPALFNGAWLTSMFTAAAMVVLYFMHKREKKAGEESLFLSQLYQFISLPLIYIGTALELTDQFYSFGSTGLLGIVLATWTAYFLCAMQFWAIRDKRTEFGNLVIILSVIGFVIYGIMHFTMLSDLRLLYLNGDPGGRYFNLHFAALPGMFALLVMNFIHARRQTGLQSDFGKMILWGVSVLVVFLSSIELDNLLLMMGINLETAHKVGYPILWGCIAFTMIALGMKHKLLQLRIAGLGLFLLILVKLFVYDIREVPTGGKIAAFISLGILLLVISFMYQRLKKLLFEGEALEAES